MLTDIFDILQSDILLKEAIAEAQASSDKLISNKSYNKGAKGLAALAAMRELGIQP